MVSYRAKKITFISCIIFMLLSYGMYQYYMYSNVMLYDFDESRDTEQMIAMFNKDWYWLFASSPDEFSVEHALKYRTPNQHEKHYFGALQIKVLRHYNKVLGFVVYYMHNPTKGQLLWLDVLEETRGKGYGYMLTQYAIDQMIAAGAKTIFLWTRVSNIPGQKIYKKSGFKEKYTADGGFVYFEYKVA